MRPVGAAPKKNEISHSKTAPYFKNRRKIEIKALRISKNGEFLKLPQNKLRHTR